MPKYEVIITSRFEVDIEDFERDRFAISEQYTVPEFPNLPEEAVEYTGGDITYEPLEH